MKGDMIYLVAPAGTVFPKNAYAAWASITGPIFTNVTLSSNGQSAWTKVPAGVAGQSYVVINKNAKQVTDSTILAGPAIVEITA